MFFADELEKNKLGLRAILVNFACLSPQGRALQNVHKFFRPGDEETIRAEFQVLAATRKFLREEEDSFRNVEGLLSRFHAVHLSLKGIRVGRILEETEWFELKRVIRLLEELRTETSLLNATQISLCSLEEPWNLLNPPDADSSGFYVYSSYSEELTTIRKKKKALEKAVLEAKPADRYPLLEERAVHVANERSMEQVVLRELGHKMRNYVDCLEDNIANAARLDFLMIRARMGEQWSAPTPIICAHGEGVTLVNAREPQISRQLEGKGETFTPQSIAMSPGASVVTGANMGGKSIALRTILLQLVLVHLGYYPACESLETELFDFFAYTTDHPGESSLGLSSFGMEAAKLREQLALSKHYRGFVVLDEPARGTNPKEARAIVTGLCRAFTENQSYLLIATHYNIPPQTGIRYYQIRGLRAEALTGSVTNNDTLICDSQMSESTQDKSTRSDTSASALMGEFALEDVQEYNQTVKRKRDLAAAKKIRDNMDYRLMETDGLSPVPAEAIRIAEWMGVDPESIELMRQAYMEEN